MPRYIRFDFRIPDTLHEQYLGVIVHEAGSAYKVHILKSKIHPGAGWKPVNGPNNVKCVSKHRETGLPGCKILDIGTKEEMVTKYFDIFLS